MEHTDYSILKLRHTIFSAIQSNADAAEAIAHRLNLSADSVRGRLSRSNTAAFRARLMRELAEETPEIAPSVQRQLDVLEKSAKIWYNWQKSTDNLTAMFVSDMHLPHPRWDAYELAMQIIEDLDVDMVSAANDALDNTGFGRWGDERPVRGQVTSSDVANLRQMELAHYRTLSIGRPSRLLIQVMGNHDLWFYDNIRATSPKTAEQQIADYMEKLYHAGVIQFSRGYNENYLQLGKGLVWWHGQYVAKSPQALAKQNIEQFLHTFNDGTLRSVVCGHTHRPMSINGAAVGYPSVKFVNSGALTDYTPYEKRHPQSRGLGIVFCEFNMQEWEHEVYLIEFLPKGNQLVAEFKGVRYSVELNTAHKEEYL